MPISIKLIREIDTVDPHLRLVLLDIVAELEQQREESVNKSDFLNIRNIVEDNSVAIKSLIEAQKRTEKLIQELIEIQKRFEIRLDRLTEEVKQLTITVQKHEIKLGHIDGRTLETEYRFKATSKFASILTRTKVVDVSDLIEELEQNLNKDEVREVMRLDLLVKGRTEYNNQYVNVLVAVEISSKADDYDIQRAEKRASLLRKAGFLGVALVACLEIHDILRDQARHHGVAVMIDTEVYGWDEAIQKVI